MGTEELLSLARLRLSGGRSLIEYSPHPALRLAPNPET